MIESKPSFLGGLDLDTSPFLVREGSYIDALNITRDADAASGDMAVSNLIGNQKINFSNNPHNIAFSIVNNGDGTQTVTFTFDPIPAAVTIELGYYLDNGDIQYESGSASSPRTLVLPDQVGRGLLFKIVGVTEETIYVYSLISALGAGTNKIIGQIENRLRNTVIYCIYNSNSKHQILEYDRNTGFINKLFESKTFSSDEDVLGFTENGKITSLNILNKDEGDELYFIDSTGRPTVLDIDKARTGELIPYSRAMLNVIKVPPLIQPSILYDADTNRRSNNFRNKFVRAKYRYVYDDNTKSVFSPVSKVIVPNKILDSAYTNVITNNNVVKVSLNTGGKTVRAIEVAFSMVEKSNNWQDFVRVETLNKYELGLGDNVSYVYSFYNDGVYPVIDVAESNLLFDWLPDLAKSQELVNGNVLAYAGITEGLDRDLNPEVAVSVLTRAFGGGVSTGSLAAVLTNHTPQTWSIVFSGTPVAGTMIKVTAYRISNGSTDDIATYITVAGDTIATIAAAIAAGVNYYGRGLNAGSNPTTVTITSGVFTTHNSMTITITAPSGNTGTDSTATWKPSTERKLALAYFDENGKTNGVLYETKVTIPAYAENVSNETLLAYINATINHQPPLWAHSFHWVITKEPTRFLYWYTIDVLDDTQHLYFDITNLGVNQAKLPTTANVLSWTFQDGDRMRLIRRQSDNAKYDDGYDTAIEGIVVDPKISGTVKTGTFVKIIKASPFTLTSFATDNFVIELYRPGLQQATSETQVYYEFGEGYQVLNPGESNRYHSGSVQNQTASQPAEFNFYEGDCYYRSRRVYLNDNGGYATYTAYDANIVDFYISAVNSVSGRPSIVDKNASRKYFPTLIRHGRAYQQNTNINDINRFFPENFDEYDYSYGDIMRLKVRDRSMRVFQKFKVGVVPIYSQISKDSGGGQLLVNTDRLLNPIQYYAGDFGIGSAPASLASADFADYFTDNNKGVVCRVSNDGITPISIVYKANSWATRELILRDGETSHIYGGYDRKRNIYILALELAGSSAAQTLTFDEKSNSFESFVSLFPEGMVTLGDLLIAFKNGNIYTHDSEDYNTFFETAYESSITMVFNKGSQIRKTFISLSEIASHVWDCPLIYTNVNSYGTQRQESNLVEEDFVDRESTFYANFLRDTNSIGGLNEGDSLKGQILVAKFRREAATTLVNLNTVQVYTIQSQLNSR
jgi:hypothetical protein